MKKLILLLVLVGLVFSIDDMTIPNTFTAGTKAVASDVNENFDSSETAVNRIVDSIQNDYPRKSDYLSSGDSSFSSFRVDTLPDAVIIDSATFGTIVDAGSVATIDINGGTIDGTTIGAVSATTGVFTVVTSDTTRPDFVRGNPIIDSAAIANLDPDTVQAFTLLGKLTAGANEIEGSAFDINGGTIDGVTIGGSAAPTVTDLGTVTTCDINGGTIDGVTIGGASASTGDFTEVLVQKDQNAATTLTIKNDTGGTAAYSQLQILSNSSAGYLSAYDDSYNDAPEFTDKVVLFADTDAPALALFARAATGVMEFYTGGIAAANKRMTIEADGDIVHRVDKAGNLSFEVYNATAAGNAYFAVKSNTSFGWFRAYSSTYAIAELQDKVVVKADNTSAALALVSAHTTGDIEFYVGGDVAAANKRMTIEADGDVLIQTDHNSATLLTVKNDTGGTSAYSQLQILSNSCSGYLAAYDDSYNGAPEFTDKVVLFADTDAPALALFARADTGVMEFYTGGIAATNKRMTIDSSGGVFMYNMKSGTTQANAGAAADELWVDTDDANTIKLGT